MTDPILAGLQLKDQLLLHLNQYPSVSLDVVAPPDQTQEGMAKSLDKAVSNISRQLKPLLDDGLVETDLRHVDGGGRRRRVYWLSGGGRQEAWALHERLLDREIEVHTHDGEIRHANLREVNRLMGLNLPLNSLLAMVQAGEPIRAEGPPMEQTRFLPATPHRFVGRKTELGEVGTFMGNPRENALVLVGLAGIGKTSLGRSIFDDNRQARPSIWYTITRWDTPESFLRPLGRLLSGLGHPLLEKKLEEFGESGGRNMLPEYLEIIIQSFRNDPRPLVILDDIHLLQGALAEFVTDLISYSDQNSGPRWVLLGRHDHALRRLRGQPQVRSTTLQGLSLEDLQELFPQRPDDELNRLIKVTGGHPLAATMWTGDMEHEPDELEEFIEHHILVELEPDERRVAEIAALTSLPTRDADILVERGLRRKSILSLVDKGLMVADAEGHLSLHELIRQPISRDMSSADKSHLHGMLYANFEGRDDDDSILRTIHHAIGAGHEDEAQELIARWGQGLVERGRSELFHVMDPLLLAEAGPVQLIHARIQLLWGNTERAGKVLGEIENDLPAELRMDWLALRAQLARMEGDIAGALELRNKLVSEPGQQTWGAGEAHNEIGLILQMEKRFDDARDHYETAIAVFESYESAGRAPPRSAGSVKPLANLAVLHSTMGDHPTALQVLEQALDRAGRRNDTMSRGRCLFYAGRLLIKDADLSKHANLPSPLECLEEAAAIFSDAGDRWGHCQVLLELAALQISHDEREEARQALDEAEKLAAQMNSGPMREKVARLRSKL